MNEDWKPVIGYEELYQVSNLGNVKALEKKVWNGKVYATKKEKILKQTLSTTGCKRLYLYNAKSERKMFKVHRIVGFAFLEKVEGKNLINHIDGNPLNNNVGNLEWCTQSENMKHAAENQLMPNNFNLYKERITHEYKTDNKTTIKMLARKYACSDSSIRLWLRKNNIPIRSISQAQNVYDINRIDLARDFDNGLKNKELVIKYKTNRHLISTYRCQHKKGVFL